jgi:hypothetical protein
MGTDLEPRGRKKSAIGSCTRGLVERLVEEEAKQETSKMLNGIQMNIQ